MIRPSVFVWVALAGAVGAGLFQLKQVVQSMDDDLLRLNRQIAAEHQNIHILRAQWSRSNHPQHIESLARAALDLEPMRPAQMSRLGDIPFRPAAQPKAQAVAGDQQPAARGVPAPQAPLPPPPAPPARARAQAAATTMPVAAPAVAALADAGAAISRGGR